MKGLRMSTTGRRKFFLRKEPLKMENYARFVWAPKSHAGVMIYGWGFGVDRLLYGNVWYFLHVSFPPSGDILPLVHA